MLERKRVQGFEIEGARLGFKNFEGKEGQFNKAGERNFVIFLDDELAHALHEDGWNVKFPKPRLEGSVEYDEEDARQPYLPVDASFDKIPPKVILINGSVTSKLDEETIGMLDWSNITYCDIAIRPSSWEVNGRSGIKAYLKNLYVTIETDRFMDKYGI